MFFIIIAWPVQLEIENPDINIQTSIEAKELYRRLCSLIFLLFFKDIN